MYKDSGGELVSSENVALPTNGAIWLMDLNVSAGLILIIFLIRPALLPNSLQLADERI